MTKASLITFTKVEDGPYHHNFETPVIKVTLKSKKRYAYSQRIVRFQSVLDDIDDSVAEQNGFLKLKKWAEEWEREYLQCGLRTVSGHNFLRYYIRSEIGWDSPIDLREPILELREDDEYDFWNAEKVDNWEEIRHG